MGFIEILKNWFLIMGAVGIIISFIALICDENPIDAFSAVAGLIGNVFGALLSFLTCILIVLFLIVAIIFILPAFLFAFIGSVIYHIGDK